MFCLSERIVLNMMLHSSTLPFQHIAGLQALACIKLDVCTCRCCC